MQNVRILDNTSPSIQHLCQKDKFFKIAFSLVGDISYTIHEDGYAFLVGEILEQMLSISVAQQIYNRLDILCLNCITPNVIKQLSDDEILSIGTSRRKVKSIKSLTNAVLSKTLDLQSLQDKDDERIIKELTTIYGIGTWTAKMYLLFVLDRPNVLPFEDVAFLQAYAWLYKTDDLKPESVKNKCKKWNPYSSIAARYMYKLLDMGFTKTSRADFDLIVADKNE